jgi:hypothetical protein
VANASGPQPWLARGTVEDLDEVAAWSIGDLRSGLLPTALLGPTDATDPVLLVCTNGRRDACCARFGRPAVLDLLERGRHEVWETSHTGGHRFAPAVVALPTGYQFGGPDATTLTTAACRGRSGLPASAQAAELAVLRRIGATAPSPLEVAPSARPDHFEVTDGNVQRWRVQVVPHDLGVSRPESCGKDPLPVRGVQVVAVTPLTDQDGVLTTLEQR